MARIKSNGTSELIDSIGNFLKISASLCGAAATVYLSYKQFEKEMEKEFKKGKKLDKKSRIHKRD